MFKMARLDIDRFISEIEQRPVIWDTRNDEYTNKLLKRKAWNELCNIFVPDFNGMDSAMKKKAGMSLYFS